jgi:hypothetical protein
MPTRKGQGTSSSSDAAAVADRAASGQVVEFDDFIDAQLRKTRSHVRSVDIATSLMVLAAGTLAYILLAAVFDHWIVAGGLGFWGRTLFLAVYLLAAAAYLGMSVVPLLVRTINPLYAAETIERSRPTLKNALVNFLFFRGHRERLSPVIYQAVEEQAARNLAGSQADGAVDRTKLITIGYVLLGVLVACAAYALASPKDLFRTVGRIAVPWAEIDAPTRTTITQIEPRDAQAFRGQQIEVSARIKDLPDDSVVQLFYSTADGQTVDRPIEMKLDADGYKHSCLLPAPDGSLQQDVDYRIEAGDAITRPFHLEVVAAPTIFVESIETKYPAYTGLLAQRVERQGDIKGIEGSEITITALANGDIRTAHVDFDCDGSPEMRMQVDGRKATARFRLALADDRRTAKHSSYQLVFTNEQGQRNPQPVRHQIEVTRDIPPEIAFVAPTEDPFHVPVNGAVTLEVVANDPDFALGLVKVSLAQGDKPLADKLLVSDTHRGQFVGKYRFQPAGLGLKPGDVVTYSALAEDNKSPNPNRTSTAKRRIRIAPPGEASGQQDQVAQNDAGDGRSQDRDQGERGQQQGKRDDTMPPDENADGNKGDGNNGDVPQDATDGPSNQGDQGEGQSTQRGKDQRPSDEPETQGERQSGAQQGNAGDAQSKPDERQQNEDKSAGGQKKDEKGSGGTSDASHGDEQQAANKSDEGGDEPSSVASDGSNDGDAIERILKHRDQQQQENGQESADSQQGNEGKQADGNQSDQRDGTQPTERGDQKQDAAGNQGDQKPGERAGDRQSGDQRSSDGTQPGGESAKDRQPGTQDGSGDKSGQRASDSGDKNNEAAKSNKPSSAEQPQREPADKSGGDQRGQSSDADADGQGDPQTKSGQSGDQQGAKQGESGQKPQQRPGADQQGSASKDDMPQGKQPGGEQGSRGKPQPGDQPGEPDPAEDGQGEGQSKDGQGAQAKNDPLGDKNAPSRDAQRSDAKGGDGEQQKGESGAGQKSEDSQGSPSPQETTKPRDKSQRPSPGDEEPKDPNDAQSPSQNQNDSDSEGQDDGDRSGGGKRGGGQKANKPGTGGAGQNTAADEGAGASEQPGDGETSNRAGDDKSADGQTGKSGDQRGKGSQSQQSAGKDGEPSADGSSDGRGADGDSPRDASSDAQSTPGGGTPAGGKPGSPDDGTPSERPYRTAPEVADEANLDYAREATDMALTHLKDELAKEQPDTDLLKDLGWTRDDLQKFVNRWGQMRRDARAPGAKGETARRELDDTLKSLGLRPRGTSLQANSGRDDQVKGMRESRHSSPPPEYAERVKAYTQGTARGGKQGN